MKRPLGRQRSCSGRRSVLVNWLRRLIWTSEPQETRPELVGLRGGWQWTVPAYDSPPSVLPPLAPGELRRDIDATFAAMEERSGPPS